ncbi:MAG: thiamine pyrophosphate-binding protein [Micropepsaceae bacterium]
MDRLDGGELLARTLAKAGVREIFALHGGHLESFLQGCVHNNIRLTDTRHEAAAGHAADGYARVTGEIGVCTVTAGPGFANAVPAIVNSYLDGTPTLFLIGAPPLREAETNPLQGGFDQIAMITPVSKWAHRVTNAERIPDLTAQAIRIARNGRPGPVVLELPIDVLHGPVDLKAITAPTGPAVRTRPAPSTDEVTALIEFLRSAQRPVIFAGGGARLAAKELLCFAELSGIPVFVNPRGYGVLPNDHPLFGKDVSNLAVLPMMGGEGPDVVLILGARLGLFAGGRGGKIIPANARIAQVDIDASEIGRLMSPEVSASADVTETLRALIKHASGFSWPNWSAWAEKAVSLKKGHALLFGNTDGQSPMHPYAAAREIMKVLGHDAIFVLDGGEAGAWAQMHVEVDEPGRVLGHGYLGCLGIGPGMAIGAQRAFPDKRVVLVTGDGAAGFHIQEFDTMVRHGLPVLTIIFNNRAWGMSIHGQDAMYGRNAHVITELADTNYNAVAQAFGCHGERVDRLEDVASAVERAVASGKPACLNIIVDREVVHPITTMLMGDAGDKKTVIPYYENIAAQ